MEAQSMGLPVIATKVGGIPEMIKHGETGLLISPSNSQALFKSLEQIMKDEKRKQALSEKSKQWAENHWSINRMTNSIMTIYTDVLRERKLTERVEDKKKRSRTPNRVFKYLNTFKLPDYYILPDPNTIHFFETKVGGIPEMIKHGETGLLISPSNSQALFKSLEQIMKDEKRKQALSEKSKQWAENHWSINRMTNSIMTIYTDVLRERKLTERVEDKKKRSRTPNRVFKYLNTFKLPDYYILPDPNTIHFFEK